MHHSSEKTHHGWMVIRSCLALCLIFINISGYYRPWGNSGNSISRQHESRRDFTRVSPGRRQASKDQLFTSLTDLNQDTELPGQQVRFEKISIEQGLSQSSVTSIIQDSKGFIWFGTEDGLNKFDGYKFTIYRHDPVDPRSLSDNYVSFLYEDQSQVLWVGTNGRGLNRFDRDTEQFIHYQNDPSDPNSLIDDYINTINDDLDGNLWIGTRNGLDRLDQDSQGFHHYTYDQGDLNSLGGDWVEAIHLDHAGVLWIGTLGGGLNRYSPSSDNFTRYRHDIINPNRISSDYVTAIDEDGAGNLWIGTGAGGLNYFDQASEKFYAYTYDPRVQDPLEQNVITSIEVDASGMIWVGYSGEGVDILDPTTGRFQHLTHTTGDPSSLSSDEVNAIFCDRSGMMWIGTMGGGVSRNDPFTSRFTHLRQIPNNPATLSANNVYSIAEDRLGNLWIGIYGGGLDYLNQESGKIVHFIHDPDNPFSLSSDDVNDVYVDQFNDVWIGTRRSGLNQFSFATNQFLHFRHDPGNPNSISNDAVNVIFEDREGLLWIGTDGGGLDRYDRTTGTFRHFQHDPSDPGSISSNIIWSLAEDRTGKLWIGTAGGGLSVLDQGSGKFTHFQPEPGDSTSLGDSDVLSIYEASQGNIWIGTDGSGLDKYDPRTGEFSHYRVSDGLPNNVVYGILEDQAGTLWVSTNLGLSQFNPDEEIFKNFDVSDGLQSNEFNVGASYMDRKGRMYFGGINGLTAFYPEDIREVAYKPPVVITGLKQSGEDLLQNQSVEDLEQVVLNWSNNNLEFEFVALNFAHPEKSQYAYKLDGFDDEWNFVGVSRIGRYTNLPGGSYILQIRATDSDGVWSEIGTTLNIKVVPPFWETWWFIGLVTIIIMASVISGYRLRIRSIESRSQELETQVMLRTQEIEQRREEMESLYEADEIIDQHLTQEGRLKALVEVSKDLLHADASSILAWDESNGEYSAVITSGFDSAEIQNLSIQMDGGYFGEVFQSRDVFVLTNLDDQEFDDQNFSQLVELLKSKNIQTAIFLPIRVGNQVYGLFNVNYFDPDSVGEAEIRVVKALTQHSALSIQNAQLFEQLRDMAISEERSRLARDLHDSAKQKAFAALAQLGAAGETLGRDPEGSKTHLLEAEDLVYEVLQELNTLIQEMYPVALREKGLAATVRDYVFEWENQSDIEVELDIHNEMRLPLEIEQSLYRVIQESLANIARHSQAKHAEIIMEYQPDVIKINVKDDGIGFDVDQKPAGLGLRSIKERVELINGDLQISSNADEGTLIEVIAPFFVRG